MRDISAYKHEVKQFKNDLIENLIDCTIDLTDFNIVKAFIIEDISREWQGDLSHLKTHLMQMTDCSILEVENLLQKSCATNWPDFFKNKSAWQEETFQIDNQLILNYLSFCDNEEEERRRPNKELKFCMLHHLQRPFECSRSMGKLYQCVRFSFCCCWTSYIWRLVCYKCAKSSIHDRYYANKNQLENRLAFACYLTTHVCCWPFFLCYFYDKKNYEPYLEYTSSNSQETPTENTTTVTTVQPTRFHYTNTFYESFLYIVLEARQTANQMSQNEENPFYFWIKIPFNFNIDLDSKKDPDLY